MNAEFLLDALGLLDDDLIQDAEICPAPSRRPRVRASTSLAACLALAAALGYTLTHTDMEGANSASGAAAPSEPSASCYESADAAGESEGQSVPSGRIYLYGAQYAPTGEIAEVLPQGAQGLGVLSPFSPGGPFPATDGADYVGCLLWQAPDGLLYIQFPKLGWIAAEPVS